MYAQIEQLVSRLSLEKNVVGLAWQIDAVHPNDNKERVQIGTQISAFDRFFVRGGYLYNHDTQNYAFGVGANLVTGNTLIEFAYSYSNYDILPVVHRISLSMNIL